MENLSNLPQIRAFEQLKKADTPEERMRLIREGGLPHEVVTPFIKTSGEWKALAKQMPIFALLRHCNSFRRHGCFSDPEFTNEIAAKLKKEDNITKSKIWPFRFYCFDEKTEIMTKQGVKKHFELKEGELVATLNDKGELEFQPIERIWTYDYDGKMVWFKGNSYDLMVTPNHRLYLRKTMGKEKKAQFEIFEARDLLNYSPNSLHIFEFKRDAEWHCLDKSHFEVPIPEDLQYRLDLPDTSKNLYSTGLTQEEIAKKLDVAQTTVSAWLGGKHHPGNKYNLFNRFKIENWLSFFGWWLAEGCVAKNGSSLKVCISQSLTHGHYREEIKEVIQRLGFKPTVCHNSIDFTSRIVGSYLKQFGKAGDKFIPTEIKELPRKKLEILLDSMMKGDGCKGYRYCTKSKRLRDDILEVGLKCGYGVSYCFANGTYRINLTKWRTTPQIRTRLQETDYNGKVWCVTTKNGIVLAGRNGKFVWSGNSAYKMLKKESREEYYPERDYLPGKPRLQITVEKEMLLPEFFEKPKEVERFSTATPQIILDALAHAYATSFKNLPEINGATVVIVDVSGSMEGKYMEIAATLGLGLLSKCTEKKGIICFSNELYPVQIAPNPLDVVENIINLPHGGTNLSLPIQYLTQNEVKADNIVVLSDMEEWMDEGFMESLRKYKRYVNSEVKTFLINVSPYLDYPTPSDEPGVYPIAGWSENIIGFISLATRAEEQTKAVEDIVV